MKEKIGEVAKKVGPAVKEGVDSLEKIEEEREWEELKQFQTEMEAEIGTGEGKNFKPGRLWEEIQQECPDLKLEDVLAGTSK